MKIFFFIFGTPFFLAVLYVIRLILDFRFSREYQVDTPVPSEFVSNLSRIIAIYMMGFLPIAIIVTIFGGIFAHIIPFSIYQVLYILADLIAYAMGIIKYRKNSKRFNSFSEKKKWILCCMAFGFLLGLLETQLASIDSPCSTVETIIGYVSSIAWTFIIAGGFRVIPDLLIDLFDKLFDKK